MNPNYAFQTQGYEMPPSSVGGSQPSSLAPNTTNAFTGYGTPQFQNDAEKDTVGDGGSTTYGGVPNFDQGYLNALDNANYTAGQPYYTRLANYDAANFNTSNNEITANYNNTVAADQNDLAKNIRALDNNEGQNGTWAGNERNLRMNELVQPTNTNLQGAYNTAQANLYNNRVSQAYNYGDSAVSGANNTPINEYAYNPSNNGYSTTTSGGEYNPFGSGFGQGTVAYNRENSINTGNITGVGNAVGSSAQSSKYIYNPYSYPSQQPTTATQ
jgi:hypothetical protein